MQKKNEVQQMSKEIINEFREIYKVDYGIKLTFKEANNKAIKMLKLFRLLSKAQ